MLIWRRAWRVTAGVRTRLLATHVVITYSSEQDEEILALVRHRPRVDRHGVAAPRPGKVVVVFVWLPASVVWRPLEFGQLPASVGPVQLHAPAPRLSAVRFACIGRPEAVGSLAIVARCLDRSGVGSDRELRVRHPALPSRDGRARLSRRHHSELAWRPPRLRAGVLTGAATRIPAHFRAIRAHGGYAGDLDQGQPDLERRDADSPYRGDQRMAGRGSLAAAARACGKTQSPRSRGRSGSALLLVSSSRGLGCGTLWGGRPVHFALDQRPAQHLQRDARSEQRGGRPEHVHHLQECQAHALVLGGKTYHPVHITAHITLHE